MSQMSLFIRNFRQLFAQDQNQLRHELGERHDRTEQRLDQAEPRLGASERRLDSVEARTDLLAERVDVSIDRADALATAIDDLRAALEQRMDRFEQNLETRLEERLIAIEKKIDMQVDQLEQKTEQKLVQATDALQQALDRRIDSFVSEYQQKSDEFTAIFQEKSELRMDEYIRQSDMRIDTRFEQIELRNDEQHNKLAATTHTHFEQHTRALDLRVDDRLGVIEKNLDQRLNGFEKGIDTRLFNREKYVDDRLVRIGDDIVARTDLLLQHSEKRMDQVRRMVGNLPSATVQNAIETYDQLTSERKALVEIAAQVEAHLQQEPEQEKAHYFKIIEWKDQALATVQRLTPDEQELADYIKSFVDLEDPKHESYLQTHMKRFVATLNRIPPPQKSTARVLELGSCFFFTPAIQKFCGYSNIQCADWYDGAETNTEVRTVKQLRGNDQYQFETKIFNAERDQFPYEDRAFDLVLCCEMLEHLGHDPMHLFWECNRILEVDGLLLVTTPNITSIRSIEGLLTGYPPYLWLKYNVQDPAQQHFHEHTPENVKLLLEQAGFEIVELETEDVWAASNPATIELLERLQFSTAMRGDNIFALARKISKPKVRYPDALYVENNALGEISSDSDPEIESISSDSISENSKTIIADDGAVLPPPLQQKKSKKK